MGGDWIDVCRVARCRYDTCDEVGMLVYHDMQYAQEVCCVLLALAAYVYLLVSNALVIVLGFH
jgi:hypothetical protein